MARHLRCRIPAESPQNPRRMISGQLMNHIPFKIFFIRNSFVFCSKQLEDSTALFICVNEHAVHFLVPRSGWLLESRQNRGRMFFADLTAGA